MAHTHDHHHNHDAHLRAAEALCASAGEALTPLRRQVLAMLLDHHGPAKAYDLLEGLKTGRSSAKPPTIYRALDFLMRMGLAHRIESLNAYVACDVGCMHAPAMFLICDRCQRISELHCEPLDGEIRAAAAAA